MSYVAEVQLPDGSIIEIEVIAASEDAAAEQIMALIEGGYAPSGEVRDPRNTEEPVWGSNKN